MIQIKGHHEKQSCRFNLGPTCRADAGPAPVLSWVGRAAVVLAALGAFTVVSAKETFTVCGTLETENQFEEMDLVTGSSGTLPLANVEVRVKARIYTFIGPWGTWKEWGSTTTDDEGRYCIEVEKAPAERQVKLEIRYQASDLQLYVQRKPSGRVWKTLMDIAASGIWPDFGDWGCWNDSHCFPCQEYIEELGSSFAFDMRDDFATSRWYEVDRAHVQPSFDTDITLKKSFSKNDGNDVARHASLWVLLHHLFDGLGSSYSFDTKLHVVYPGQLADGQDASFADPLTGSHNTVYLNDNDFSTETVLHEVMHVWAYQHSRGEEELAYYLFDNCDTHCGTSPTVAFHEGFAEYAAGALMEELFGMSLELPFNRHYLANGLDSAWGGGCNEDELRSIGSMESHDAGWWTFLRTLTTVDLGDYLYGNRRIDPGSSRIQLEPSSQICDVVTFWDILDVIDNLNTEEVDFDGFLERVVERVTGANADPVLEYMTLMDSDSATEPYCVCSAAPALVDFEISDVELTGPYRDALTFDGLVRRFHYRVEIANKHETNPAEPGTVTLRTEYASATDLATAEESRTVPGLEPSESVELFFTVTIPRDSDPTAGWRASVEWTVEPADEQCEESLSDNTHVLVFDETYLNPDYQLEQMTVQPDPNNGLVYVEGQVVNRGPVSEDQYSLLRITTNYDAEPVEVTVRPLTAAQGQAFSAELPHHAYHCSLSAIAVQIDVDENVPENIVTVNGDLVDGEENNFWGAVYGKENIDENCFESITGDTAAEDLLGHLIDWGDILQINSPELDPTLLVDGLEWYIEWVWENSGNGPLDPSLPEDVAVLIDFAHWHHETYGFAFQDAEDPMDLLDQYTAASELVAFATTVMFQNVLP